MDSNEHTRLFQMNGFNIPLYIKERQWPSLIILDIYNTTPLVNHLNIIKGEYYHIYFYYPALLSRCKQTLIHHQSSGSFISWGTKRKYMCCVDAVTCAAWELAEIGSESMLLHLLFIESLEHSIYQHQNIIGARLSLFYMMPRMYICYYLFHTFSSSIKYIQTHRHEYTHSFC